MRRASRSTTPPMASRCGQRCRCKLRPALDPVAIAEDLLAVQRWRKQPRMQLVTRLVPGLCTPRVVMQVMQSLEDHADALRLEVVIYRVGDLRRHLSCSEARSPS